MIALLLACAPNPKQGESAAAPDTAELGDEAEVRVEPQWTADEATEALTTSLAMGLPESATLRGWFLELITAEVVDTPGCFDIDESDDGSSMSSVWSGTCTGASGYEFDGLWLYQETTSVANGSEMLQSSLLASFSGVSAQGVKDLVGGTLTLQRSQPSSGTMEFIQECGGLWSAPDEPDWLGLGVGLGLSIQGSVTDGKITLSLEGGANYGDSTYLYFQGITLDELSCGRAPMGEVWIRDPSTSWIIFDFGEDCDGCADVSAAGEDWGEQCVGDALWVAAANATSALASED